MVKFIALYKRPADREDFEKKYFDTHIPLVNKIPGLIKAEVSRLTGMPGQEEKYYLMAEMYFDDIDSLNKGMSSAEGKAAAKNLMSFAQDVVSFMNAEVLE